MVVQWLRLCPLNARGLGAIPGEGTRSHVLQLRVNMPKLRPSMPELKVKEESEKIGLKLNIQKTKVISDPITSWQIDGETMEIVRGFTFWGSKITADGDSGYEIKRCLLLGRKAMTNLDSILKSRDIILTTMVRLVKLWF